jgi:hypothetical protein
VQQFAMPAAANRIQRHFAPITYRATFSPERLVESPPITLRKVFPMLEGPIPHWNHGGGTSDGSSESSEDEVEYDVLPMVTKPKGEAGRIKDGYQLRDVVNWDKETFSEVEVRIRSTSHPIVYLMVLAGFRT